MMMEIQAMARVEESIVSQLCLVTRSVVPYRYAFLLMVIQPIGVYSMEPGSHGVVSNLYP